MSAKSTPIRFEFLAENDYTKGKQGKLLWDGKLKGGLH